jgi:hypothetical protein
MRELMKSLAVTISVEPTQVIAGGTAVVTVTIRNTSPAESDVLLEARTRAPGPRPDWSRVLGVPEQREPPASSPEALHLFLPMTTTDSSGREVDALPTLGGGAAAPPTVLEVHLRPGGKLTHTASWWALRIPAPAPVVQDDAGHRYVPKTTALPLSPGEYNLMVELPFFGLTREERKISTPVHVVKAPPFDASVP